ncbi:glycosyltransferase [Kitasatospora aureofaciens]|uniref:glycosyltransferase n=1 Tax=Kitasatospora aureofaciens TaxID=1894 RepID=UPI0036F46094
MSVLPGRDLVWLGRIDEEKAPHLAVRAAQLLGRRISIVGPVFDTDYLRRHQALLSADHVTWVGELGGAAKTAAFSNAAAFVYTCSRTYVEAGAAVFGESLRAGTPVAALCWRQGTCAEAAICDATGVSAYANPHSDDEEAAQALAVAIEQALSLDATTVQEIGFQRFDPARHFRVLATSPC